ncbi:hypothetical protein GCK72_007173 [Caenorhabditis remanei]|uniref:Uncharacterized protein n=1 Tax=Caenorhabditis remanei TaxID=31234 RepID=A0A6A5HKU0_CAERE|nr:hypothetical protein GCK72_007173 [Caenorhabditis remanei]KAF1767214.1 hypothetical protein GCK72_007173 [Caenorhabditis remanei]
MDYGATLVTIKNANDNHAVSTIAGTSVALLWMGLYCFDSDPSKCLWDDSTGSADMYNSFAAGFPQIAVGKCVYYSVQGALAGKWLSGDCEKETKAYICELPITRADDCKYNYNGHCYTFHDVPTAFVQAQEACEKDCGNLASVTSANENRYIATLSNRLFSGNFYIGGLWPSSNVFYWFDGSAWNYNNIDPSYSHNANCIAVSNSIASSVASGLWFSIKCHIPYSFVCKRPAGTKCSGNQPIAPVTPVPPTQSFCNSSLLLSPGVITSPNFPFSYDNSEFCSYQLATLGSYNVLLRFSDFATVKGVDFVNVYDGDSVDSKLLGTYTGQFDAFSLVSSGNTMLVTFKSGSGKTAQGFSARFTSYSYGR